MKKPVEQFDVLRDLREFLRWRLGDSIILAEANVRMAIAGTASAASTIC